jgi:hypothetical protein
VEFEKRFVGERFETDEFERMKMHAAGRAAPGPN